MEYFLAAISGIIAALLGAMLVSLILKGLLMRLSKEQYDKQYDLYDRWVAESERQKDGSIQISKVIEEKKKKFLDIPNVVFHFANKEQLEGFYNDYFKEPTVQKLVSEITKEVKGGVKGSVPKVLEANIGTSDLTKWISQIKLPNITLEGKFIRYQREIIRNDQVTLGLEELEVELSELQEFEKAISGLKDQYGLKLDDEILDNHRVTLKQKASENTLKRLEQASDMVLVEGRFKITREDNSYNFLYQHPVNKYLPESVGPITITLSILSDLLEPQVAGNYERSIGHLLPLKVFAKVWQPINLNDDVCDLQLLPLAVY